MLQPVSHRTKPSNSGSVLSPSFMALQGGCGSRLFIHSQETAKSLVRSLLTCHVYCGLIILSTNGASILFLSIRIHRAGGTIFATLLSRERGSRCKRDAADLGCADRSSVYTSFDHRIPKCVSRLPLHQWIQGTRSVKHGWRRQLLFAAVCCKTDRIITNDVFGYALLSRCLPRGVSKPHSLTISNLTFWRLCRRSLLNIYLGLSTIHRTVRYLRQNRKERKRVARRRVLLPLKRPCL